MNNQGPDKKALAVLGIVCLLLLAYVCMGVMQGQAHAAEVMECTDEWMPPAITAPDKAAAVTAKLVDEARERAQEVEQAADYDETAYEYQESDYAAYNGYEAADYEPYSYSNGGFAYTVDENGVIHAEYSEYYNTDGPDANMTGWHDGYLETWFNASNHYLASNWTVDGEGFYHDENGRYVVGVEIHHQDDMPYGTVIETGKGEGVVYDYGAGWEVHDFAVNHD